jgi:hypothetical protein
MSFWSKTVKLVTGVEPTAAKKTRQGRLTRRDLIRLESKIGAQLFGPVPEGHRREFFNLDDNTWVWYEEWTDQNGKHHELTTRYEVHPNGVLKVQDGQPYAVVEGEELRNLAMATRLYYERIAREIYQRDPKTGRSLVA